GAPGPPLRCRRDALHVIAVLVGHEAAVDRLRGDADRPEPPGERPRAEAAVDEHSRIVALDQDGVAAASAPQHPELHRVPSTRQRAACTAARWRRPFAVSSTCRRAIIRAAVSANLPASYRPYGGAPPHENG